MSELKGLQQQTWSMSKIKLLENCPLSFYLTYIVKFRHINEAQDTLERDLGIAVHSIFENMQNGMTISEAYDVCEQEHYQIIGSDNWPRLVGMLPNVRKFNRIMHDKDEYSNFDWVEPELKLAVDRDWNPVDFFSESAYFRGVVDYMARCGDVATVIDYKKGGSGWLTKYHSPQLTSYLLLDYYCNGKFAEGQSYIYYVESGEFSAGPKLTGDAIESHTKLWLKNKIDVAIQNVVEEGYFKHIKGNHCKYCDYANLCTDGKRGTCGSLTQYSIDSKEIL